MALSTTNLSLNQIIQSFAMLANNHGMINSFGQGFEDEYIATTVTNYPLFWVSIMPSNIGSNTVQYNFRFVLMDLVDTDKKNSIDVLSDTLQILWDLIATIRDVYDLEVLINSDATPFEEMKDDRVSGHYLDIGILIPRDFGSCNAPINNCN
jgi:hypothetical protein